MSDVIDADWYETFFGDVWLQFAQAAPAERTAQQVDFVVERIKLEPGARILDLACGHGRHAVPLAERGFRVTGLDLSDASLALARERAGEAGVELELVRGDMRDLPWDVEFDAVINLFTSFGYFEDEADHERVARAVARALRPGGAFLIDTVNLLGLVQLFRERSWEQFEDEIVLQRHELELLTGRARTWWTFVDADGSRRELSNSARTFAPHELAALLHRAGLEIEAAYGDFEGAELSMDSWRLILLARKPNSRAAADAKSAKRPGRGSDKRA
jgi:SAM-dependent methyltransferase